VLVFELLLPQLLPGADPHPAAVGNADCSLLVMVQLPAVPSDILSVIIQYKIHDIKHNVQSRIKNQKNCTYMLIQAIITHLLQD
jgi:hypothetical protein